MNMNSQLDPQDEMAPLAHVGAWEQDPQEFDAWWGGAVGVRARDVGDEDAGIDAAYEDRTHFDDDPNPYEGTYSEE